MAILGTLLVSLVVARSRYLEQLSRAGRKKEAVDAANALLCNWYSSAAVDLKPGRGRLNDLHLRWRTSIVKEFPELDARVMRLEIFDANEPAEQKKAPPLTSVDLLVDAHGKTLTKENP
jgi:hypothetical protein